ncbi:thiol-disulfide oxidoreductase DCC family protein [Pandoraea sp. NPDC090278]|uniref:thiol-disulfide oxidoreductase DCC family protein n=1 Tax=Pandoraea sp. NPDC090278 TaxID=3364391 RepID=UPI003839EC17
MATSSPIPELTLYVDGNCPICMTEVGQLRARDHARKLAFVDIADPAFDPAPLGVSLEALGTLIHGWTADGDCVIGIDALIAAYTLTGRRWLVAPLRVPALRPAARVLYRTFAQHRMRLSRWLRVRNPGLGASGPSCTDGVCATKMFGEGRRSS